MQLHILDRTAKALGFPSSAETGYSISLGWYWEEWAFGWADMFTEFGIGDLIIGPLHIHVTWPLREWPGSSVET